MDFCWLKLSPNLGKVISLINNMDITKFEKFLYRIMLKMKIQEKDFFSEEEQLKLQQLFQLDENNLRLIIKTVVYLFKRLQKFIFMPNNLKNDLKEAGLSNEMADLFVKIWSSETRDRLSTVVGAAYTDDGNECNSNFSWKVDVELSSEYHKKCKIPKAYLTLSTENDNTEMELVHADLYSMFLQFESIQNELDNLTTT